MLADLIRASGALRLLCGLAALSWAATGPALAQPSPAPDPPENGQVRGNHGAWQVNCATPPGSSEEKCALVQSVTAEDRPNVGLTVTLFETSGDKKKLLRVVAPLGVLLPTGLGLKIDGADVGNAPFLKCGRNGCIAEVVLQDDLIEKFKAGQQAIFIIFETPEAGIGIPIVLAGLGEGLASLK
jgi:invasion protein IalB